MRHHMDMNNQAWWGAGDLLGLLFLSALAIGASLFVWYLFRTGRLHLPGRTARPALAVARPGHASDAERELDLRLAQGEIDVDDYHERRSALRANW